MYPCVITTSENLVGGGVWWGRPHKATQVRNWDENSAKLARNLETGRVAVTRPPRALRLSASAVAIRRGRTSPAGASPTS